MNKYLVLYMAPASMMEEWMKTDPEVRKVEEEKMKADWDAWMGAHKEQITETAGAGKTKRVSKDGVVDAKNDIMLYSIATGESTDAVAKMFEGHPHFGIPGAWIEVMPAKYLPGMDGN
jgi:hypothetical protein